MWLIISCRDPAMTKHRMVIMMMMRTGMIVIKRFLKL